VLVALAVRWAFILLVDPVIPDLGDASAYRMLAEGIANGRGYVRPYDFAETGALFRTAEYPPLFPFLLSLAHRVGLDTIDQQRMFMALFGSGTVGVIGLVGRRIGGVRVGLAAAALAAVYPMLFQADAALMPETLAALGAAVVTLFALRLWEHPGVGNAAALGLATGFTILTRAEAALLLPLVVGAFVLLRRGGPAPSRRLVLAGVAVACAVGVVAPWTIRNALVFDEFVPVSNNLGSVTRGSNCDLAYQGDFRGMWVTSVDPKASVDPEGRCFGGFVVNDGQNEAESAAILRRDGLDYIGDHRGEVPEIMAVRWARTFGLYRPSQQTAFESLEGRSITWERFGTRVFYALALVATAGAVVLGRRRPAYLWPLVATVVAVSVTTMITYGNQRFRAGAEPAFVVLAAVAVVALFDQARQRRTAGRRDEPAADDGPDDGRDGGDGAGGDEPSGSDPVPHETTESGQVQSGSASPVN
jgi:4-amino-4-deoxy-L-arabinose transferase-like glycosyltransferase